MLTLRRSAERGHASHGWLDSHHSFSFASYYDPRHMGVSHLRVINEDRVAPGAGFGTHGHRDMEIISYVLSGALEHKDSMGNSSVIHAGEVQRMSAGTGVTHSEFNASDTEPVHFLQIWILPDRRGVAPGYEQIRIGDEEKRGRLRLIASADGRDGSVSIHQDACVYAGLLSAGESVTHALREGRVAYVHLVRGEAKVNGVALSGGDALTLRAEPRVMVEGEADAELLLFDLDGVFGQ